MGLNIKKSAKFCTSVVPILVTHRQLLTILRVHALRLTRLKILFWSVYIKQWAAIPNSNNYRWVVYLFSIDRTMVSLHWTTNSGNANFVNFRKPLPSIIVIRCNNNNNTWVFLHLFGLHRFPCGSLTFWWH